MKIMNVCRCLSFLVLAVGTARGSSVEEIKKFDPDVEEYLSKNPETTPLFKKATPEEIERWRQCHQCFEELRKEKNDVSEGYRKIRNEEKNIFELLKEINSWDQQLEALRAKRLTCFQDMIKNYEQYFKLNPCACCSKDPPFILNDVFYSIYSSQEESTLSQKIFDSHAQLEVRRKILAARYTDLDQRNKKICMKYKQIFSELGLPEKF